MAEVDRMFSISQRACRLHLAPARTEFWSLGGELNS